MINPQHIFSHQQQYPQAEPSWHHQQQSHHQQQHPHHAAHQHAHAQAVAQHQHYNRMGANNSGTNGHGMNMDHNSGPNSAEGNWIEENRRVLGWVAELLNGNSRETALMELSKKREQVPELALIIWHSFGRLSVTELKMATDSTIRCHDFSAPGDHLSLPSTQPITTNSRSLKPCVQRSCAASVRSFAQRDPWAVPQWYVHAVYTSLRAG